MYFDGSGDYLQIEDNSLRNLHNGANDFTIECWVNISAWQRDSSGQQRAHILGTGGSSAEVGIWLVAINQNNNGFVFRVTKGISGITEVWLPSRTQVNLNTWYHVAVSYNSDTYKLFVDGLLVNESTGNHTHSNANSYGPFRVGRFSWPSNTSYFKGYLQDLRISSKAVYTGCFKLPTTFQSEECIPTPTPIPQPTPTPTPVITRGELEVATTIGSNISTIKQTNGDFKVGDCIIIGRGTDKEEHLQISRISYTPITGVKYQSCETDYVAPASDPDFELPSVPPKVNILKYEECEGLTLPEIVDYVLPESTDLSKVRKYAYCNEEWNAIETFDYELPDETIQDPIRKYTQCDDSRPTLETFDYELPSETIQDPIRKYAKCGWVREVTLSFNYHIPNHPDDASMANGTATKTYTISVTSGQPVVDFEFYHSFATGLDQNTWTASNAKLTFPDNTIVSVELTDKKVTSGTYEHPQNGNQTAYAVRYTFDVPNFVQDETQDFLDSIEYLLIVPPATGGVEDHNPTIISTDSINPKTLPTEWPTGTTYDYGDN